MESKAEGEWAAEEEYAEQAQNAKFNKSDEPVAVRLNDKSTNSIMGVCHRHAVTGKPILKNASTSADYCIVDLWERSALYGSPDDLVLDPYLFKIVPMPMRTWLYHSYFGTTGTVSRSSGDNGIMQTVLRHKVIDADKHAGRWSPAICSAPSAFVSIFIADFGMAFACILMTFFNLASSSLSNSPRFFGISRWLTLFPRIVFFFFMLARMFQFTSEGAIVILCFLVILGLLCVDFLAGDLQAVWGIGWRCHYEVIRLLPSRIFVCRKMGAAFLTDTDSNAREISQLVTGMGHFEEMVLIAERGGLIVQLKPMTRQDWATAWEIRTDLDRPLSFVGLDVFNKEARTAFDLECGNKDQSSSGAEEALISKATKGQSPPKDGNKRDRKPELLE